LSDLKSMEENPHNICSILTQLVCVGVIINDFELVDIILPNLPSSWTIVDKLC